MLDKQWISGKLNFLNMQTFPYSSADEHIIYKTGKGINEWFSILDNMKANRMRSRDVIAYLQIKFNIPEYRATALNAFYLRRKKT
jgi:hypothetical protein